jgi:hypothetical protein
MGKLAISPLLPAAYRYGENSTGQAQLHNEEDDDEEATGRLQTVCLFEPHPGTRLNAPRPATMKITRASFGMGIS